MDRPDHHAAILALIAWLEVRSVLRAIGAVALGL